MVKIKRLYKDRGLNSKTYRVCRICKKLKNLYEFSNDRCQKYEKSYICRECEKVNNRIRYLRYYFKNREEILKRRKERHQTDKLNGHKKAQDKAFRKVKINTNICQICKKVTDKLERHHFDYTKPLEVVFVCRSCHRLIHSQLNCRRANV